MAEEKKRKKAFWKASEYLQPGMKGILITCTRGKEAQCVREAINVFSEFLDESDVKSDEEEKDEEEIDFREAFEKEMEQLKSTDKKIVKIRNIKMDVECVVFLKVHSSINPVELVKKVLENAQETKISRTRYCSRIVPIEAICHADLESIEKIKEKVFSPHFHQGENQTPQKFCILYNARNHLGGLKREDVIKRVASLVGKPHIVDLKNPDKSIIIEIFKGVCCVSIVENYNNLKKFNIMAIVGIDIHPKQKKKIQPEEEEKGEEKDEEKEQSASKKQKIEDNEESNGNEDNEIKIDKPQNEILDIDEVNNS